MCCFFLVKCKSFCLDSWRTLFLFYFLSFFKSWWQYVNNCSLILLFLFIDLGFCFIKTNFSSMNIRWRSNSNIFITIIINWWVKLRLSICLFIIYLSSWKIELNFVIISIFIVFLFTVLIRRLPHKFPRWPLIKLRLVKAFVWL